MSDARDPRPVLGPYDEVEIVAHECWTEVYRREDDGSIGPLLRTFQGPLHEWRARLWPIFAERKG